MNSSASRMPFQVHPGLPTLLPQGFVEALNKRLILA